MNRVNRLLFFGKLAFRDLFVLPSKSWYTMIYCLISRLQKTKGQTMKNLTHASLFCALALVSPLFADDPSESVSLGCDSQNAVTLATVEGGLAGFGTLYALYALTHGFNLPKLSENRYSIALFTLGGAVIGGLWKYQYTPERQFIFARKALLDVSENELFTLLVTTEHATLISILKDRYFREKLPLYTAYKQLDKICAIVDQSKDSLKEVLGSYRTDLYQETNELLMIADIYLGILKDVFKLIKDDPNFINECNAGTLELMKEAQEAAASAAQSSAFSQQMALMSNQTPNISVYAMPNQQ